MRYVGLVTRKARNNTWSVLLLCLFPCMVAGLTFLGAYLLLLAGSDGQQQEEGESVTGMAVEVALQVMPYVLGIVLAWFVIAYFANTAIINAATGARPLQRKENKRVYNLVENLCVSRGMTMPRVNVINDSSLNACASGINKRTYTVTLTTGIIEKLDDDELEGVIAHELSHILHRDVRLLIVSIVFVGIFAMLAQVAWRALVYSPRGGNKKGNNGTALLLLVLVVVALVGYFFANLTRLAISRKREYMADAGAAIMTRKPLALASALRAISADPNVEAITRQDVAQLFIEHPRGSMGVFQGLGGLFATHPPIRKRIEALEQV